MADGDDALNLPGAGMSAELAPLGCLTRPVCFLSTMYRRITLRTFASGEAPKADCAWFFMERTRWSDLSRRTLDLGRLSMITAESHGGNCGNLLTRETRWAQAVLERKIDREIERERKRDAYLRQLKPGQNFHWDLYALGPTSTSDDSEEVTTRWQRVQNGVMAAIEEFAGLWWSPWWIFHRERLHQLWPYLAQRIPHDGNWRDAWKAAVTAALFIVMKDPVMDEVLDREVQQWLRRQLRDTEVSV